MNFTEKEKELALQLKQKGLKWKPEEGDWFWVMEEVSHHFYLGENLPASYFFQRGGVFLFDSSMIWHLQHGGLNISSFVWLPSWNFCRKVLRNKEYLLELHDSKDGIFLRVSKKDEQYEQNALTDLEAVYSILLQTFPL